MASSYHFFVAGHDHDAALRRLLCETPMTGPISISFKRDPSYLQAACVEGRFTQILAVHAAGDNTLAGMGARGIKPCHVNGQIQPVGYLSHLRLHPTHRRKMLIGRGYQFLHSLHQDGRTPFYLTTITEGNTAAIKTLTGCRAKMPLYRFAGRVYTFVLSSAGKYSGQDHQQNVSDMTICPATCDDLPKILELWRREGSRQQFFPDYQLKDIGSHGGLLHGLEISDILLAWRNKRIVGTFGIWDQSRYKQLTINGYSGVLRWMRPIINSLARIKGSPQLPPAGSCVRCVNAAVPVVENDDPSVFKALLHMALKQIDPSKHDYLMAGCHENSPLFSILNTMRGISYVTHLYIVGWDDGISMIDSLDERPIYLELGSL